MPWSQTMPRDQRVQFIADYLRNTLSMTELCDLYHVSRKTGYKWAQRYLRRGPIGLEELSRKPRVSPNQTPAERVAALLEARRHHPSWGAKKLLKILRKKHPRWSWPHRGTVCEILSRHGLVPHKRRRRLIGHPGKPTTQILAPNDVWSADFKGQFKTTNGTYCYPLTVTDGYSRFLLGCQALHSTSVAEAKPVFLRLFQEFGLPQRIRTDNGVPFATNTLGRLSQLSAWWVRLGVLPEFIEPGKPQQNGRHERMHRTLKAETTRPPLPIWRLSSASSTPSARSLTTSAPMKPWTWKLLLTATPRRCDRCPTKYRRWNTRIASRCVTSAPTAASVGNTTGSMSRPSVPATT